MNKSKIKSIKSKEVVSRKFKNKLKYMIFTEVEKNKKENKNYLKIMLIK